MPKAVPFSIEADAIGFSKVVVDGEDVTKRLNGAQLIAAEGQPTALVLFSNGAGTITGEALVTVSEKFLMEDWLRNLPVVLIDQEALNRQEWGDGATLTQTVLTILLERLHADQS